MGAVGEKMRLIAVLSKPIETWIFVYDDHRVVDVLLLLGEYAADPEMSFNWYDAAKLAREIRDPKTELGDERWNGLR